MLSNVGMLGRLRRTTPLDVGLAMALGGIAFLVWGLVAGVARSLVQDMIRHFAAEGMALPRATQAVRVMFVDAGFVIDLAGLAWLVVSLVLVFYSSRQRITISWAWLSAILQSFVAALGGIFVAWAVHLPYRSMLTVVGGPGSATAFERVSELSLPVVITLAILIWVWVLIRLLVDRARLNRHGPTLTDGLRTHSYR